MDSTISSVSMPTSGVPFLRILPAHRVIVCLECQKAVPSLDLDRHLLTYHRILGRQRTEWLKPWMSCDVRQRHEEFDALPDGSSPIIEFPVVDGFACRLCRFLTRNRDAVMAHVSKTHDIRGEAGKKQWTTARLQQWFNNDKKRCRWWIVDDTPSADLSWALPAPPAGEPMLVDEVPYDLNVDAAWNPAHTVPLPDYAGHSAFAPAATNTTTSEADVGSTAGADTLIKYMKRLQQQPLPRDEATLQQNMKRARDEARRNFMKKTSFCPTPAFDGPLYIARGFYAVDAPIDFSDITAPLPSR